MKINDELSALLRCPVCGGSMMFFAGNSPRVACAQKHSYDVSRWINFLTHPVTDHYHKALFEARREIWNSGLYDRLAERLAQMLAPNTVLLDAGCGEGSPLIRLLTAQDRRTAGKYRAVGLDLSKAAIRMAAKADKEIGWIVGDLTRLPLRDQHFDAVLNLMSPACYHEFARILKPEGTLIKVWPEAGYLQEIRKLLPEHRHSPDIDLPASSAPRKTCPAPHETLSMPREALSSPRKALSTPREAITGRLDRQFTIIHSEQLCYTHAVIAAHKFSLVRMTPMCADYADEECEKIADRLGDTISIDLRIIKALPQTEKQPE